MSLALASTAVLAESAAGLKWTAPPGWTNQGATSMRAATYAIAAATGDRDAGECAVFFFGAGQGGGIDANLARWKGQFTGPGGTPATGKVAVRTVRGLKVTTLDISGDYSGMGGPMAPSARAVPGYRLLGAIVEGPGGNIFVKFTGPSRTVAANQPKFDQLIASFQPEK
jgi:hypothetical protein